MNPRLSSRLTARWLPARTIRLRLTLAYGGLFLASGATLLAITYLLVRHQYTGTFFISSGRQAVAHVVHTPASSGALTIQAQQAGRFAIGVPVGTKLLALDPKLVLAAAHSQSTAALNQLLVNSGIALAIMALLSIWLGWLTAGRALRPLRTITNTAREISANNLHRRLALQGPDDELKQLGTIFDQLLARLEASFEAQRQFVANASHELRTPLTLERTLLELALSDPNPSLHSYQHTCQQLLAVGHQQEHLIEALLTLSHSQRGLHTHQPVDLAAIAAAAAAAAAAANHDGLTLTTNIHPAHTSGDPRLVERLVANLISNATRHNHTHGHINLTTETRDDRALLTITNTGPTIPTSQLERIYQPFQRLDTARTSHSNGLGLGLSIVKAIADAHNATTTTQPQPNGGLHIQISFPTSPDPHH